MGDVWVVGSLNIDLVSRVQRLPGPGETVLGSDFQRLPGGKGANQAVAAAAAGATVHMIGRVGNDEAGAAYVSGLARRSVDTSGIAVESDCPSGHALVLVDDAAENCIVVIPGANGRVDESDLQRFQPAAGDVVLLQLEIPAPVVAAALTRAKESGARSVLNLAPYRDLDPQVIERCDIVVVNEHEARQLQNTDAAPKSVVVTRGARGATWGDRSAVSPADAVVDTTGAGDAFVGALAAALAAGDDDQAALEHAVAAGAAAVAWPGAQGWTF
jgi:ribokinase